MWEVRVHILQFIVLGCENLSVEQLGLQTNRRQAREGVSLCAHDRKLRTNRACGVDSMNLAALLDRFKKGKCFW